MIQVDLSTSSRSDPEVAGLLRLENVSTAYAGSPVNRKVSCSIAHGEVVALIGRNGVGKTTLAKAIIGLVAIQSGTIWLDGSDISHSPAHRRSSAGIGYVPQGRGIFGSLSVEENLRMGLGVGQGKFSIDRAYSIFPILFERRRQNAGTLSGGQQQMLAIGRVLAGTPKLLVLDEPSDGIQPSIIDMLSEAIPRLNQQLGLTTLLIEQNLDFIMACSNRCYVMEKGSLVAELEPKALADAELAKRYLAI